MPDWDRAIIMITKDCIKQVREACMRLHGAAGALHNKRWRLT